MAVIVTVHGTWVHSDNPTGSRGETAAERQWWQPGSEFERELRELVGVREGALDVESFEWSGANSETARRTAGRALCKRLRQLEAKGLSYVLVGHSHGGSVISAALLECAARKEELKGLKRWITIGTPFISLRRERLLFQRLDLIRKIIMVASMMLFGMFGFYFLAEALSKEPVIFGKVFQNVLTAIGVMTCLPILFFYLLFKYLDARDLVHQRRTVRARAASLFGPRWRSLTHSDDEAVQGLGYLPSAKLTFFEDNFAVQNLTLLSVISLPLLYLIVVSTPPVMVAIAGWLKTSVYDSRASVEVEQSLRELNRRVQAPLPQARTNQTPEQKPRPTQAERTAMQKDYREIRRGIEAQHGNVRGAERALRFRERFFERNHQPCEGGKLCGGGADFRINSALLLHIVTDELSWALGAEETSDWLTRSLWTLVLQAVLVPLLAGLVALGIMLVVNWLARHISALLSRALNAMTSWEVKQTAFGNDTETEVATGAVDRPTWLDRSPSRLPAAVADRITSHSDAIATRSLTKLRKAIGQLTAAERAPSAENAVATYFTWKELVHSAYFDVPQFRKLVARTVIAADGFVPSTRFRSDPDFAHTGQWLAEIEGAPGGPPPDTAESGARDAAAVATVAAVVASTVKPKA